MTGSILLLATLTAAAGTPSQHCPTPGFPQPPAAPCFHPSLPMPPCPTAPGVPAYPAAPQQPCLAPQPGYAPEACVDGTAYVMPTIMLPTDPALFGPMSTEFVFPKETLDERVAKLEKALDERVAKLEKGQEQHGALLESQSADARALRTDLAEVKSTLNSLTSALRITNKRIKTDEEAVEQQLAKLARQIQKVATAVDGTTQEVEKVLPIHRKQLELLTISLKRLALHFESSYEKQQKELALLERSLKQARAQANGNVQELKKAMTLHAEVHNRMFRALETKVTQSQLESVVEQINVVFKMLAAQAGRSNDPDCPKTDPSTSPPECPKAPSAAKGVNSDAGNRENQAAPQAPAPADPVLGPDVVSAPYLPAYDERVVRND